MLCFSYAKINSLRFTKEIPEERGEVLPYTLKRPGYATAPFLQINSDGYKMFDTWKYAVQKINK